MRGNMCRPDLLRVYNSFDTVHIISHIKNCYIQLICMCVPICTCMLRIKSASDTGCMQDVIIALLSQFSLTSSVRERDYKRLDCQGIRVSQTSQVVITRHWSD